MCHLIQPILPEPLKALHSATQSPLISWAAPWGLRHMISASQSGYIVADSLQDIQPLQFLPMKILIYTTGKISYISGFLRQTKLRQLLTLRRNGA
ncbi:hypothetical protein NQZ68_016261, partial [Dissostichus eleginoides]